MLIRNHHNDQTFCSLKTDSINVYTNAFRYDSMHCISRKLQSNTTGGTSIIDKNYDWTYSYNATKPHAVTSICMQAMTYNPNGNMTKSADRSISITRILTWDVENRLAKVANAATSLLSASTRTTFAYDDD